MFKKKITPLWVDLIILDVAILALTGWSRFLHGWRSAIFAVALIILRGVHAVLKARKPRASRKHLGKRHSK
jgi:hypothetical protein